MGSIICPNCGTENPGENQFCQSCGKALSAPKPAAADKTVIADRSKKAAVPPPPSVGAATSAPKPVRETQTPPPPPMPVGAAVPPPPPLAPRSGPQGDYQATSINKLGICTDGWSDVIEEAAPLAEKIKQEFLKEMNAAVIPGLHMAESNLVSGESEVRSYQLIYNGKGSSIAVRVAPFGKDLAISWNLFSQRSINWLTVGILGGSVFLITFLFHLVNGAFNTYFFVGFFNFITTFLSWLLVPGLGLLLFGKIMRDKWLAFYAKDIDEFAADDAAALSTVVDNALSLAVEKAHDK
jgi:hypothetical protein